MKMVVKCRLNKEVRAMLSSLLAEFSKSAGKATVSIDLNPLRQE